MTATETPNPLEIRRLDASSSQFGSQLEQLRRQLSPSGDVVSPKGRELTQRVFGEPLLPSQVVQRICDAVQSEGQPALLRFSQQLDGAELAPGRLRLETSKLEEAHRAAAPEFLASIRRIRDNILAFQSSILHTNVTIRPSDGVRLDQRYVPLRRIGVCVPGGAAAYPSTVLMTVLPAQAAGVEQIAVVAPPTQFGAYNPDVLATCYELGVREVYPVGGAQAVAAMAYGVEGLPAVDKIVGPGNLFVALAKKRVYGEVDIDSIAGPSEVVIVADDSTHPAYTAADMLAQAEHSPGASLLVTWDPQFIDRVQSELELQLAQLSRSALTHDSLNAFGAFILVRDADQACEVTDLIAPEHLHIACRHPRKLAEKIRNAGATFLGPFSPVALGDYAAGPSHVLPTGGTARWAAGLSANAFLRSSSIIEYSQAALEDIAGDISNLATKEGLTAHRRSVEIRTHSPAAAEH
ncbi:histidinol dehydrogenase [Aureliella helgolandensis]|uniref:Histidinol dehydrogenase n=1 Tax=Aureliella helgolandensis TaxID=2527968 RepID=A0A518GHE6_9BACT|nr:histidinol dehydrogenase [Aureliella helgolandensis]QDV28022.1 Histidinol dehydrogenase [Aureliella helgolandensis]